MQKLLGCIVVALLAMGGVALALPPGGTFVDDDGNIHEPDIEAIAAAGITVGCNPPINDQYCPDANVTRAEMAALLLRGIGQAENLPTYQGYFPDVPAGQWYTPYVEKLYELGVSQGYPDGTYGPFNPVNRGEMAAFVLRALGEDDSVVAYRGLFTDVPASIWYNVLAERMYDLGRACPGFCVRGVAWSLV